MLRRQLLQLLGTSLSAAALPSALLAGAVKPSVQSLNALQQNARRFASARKTHPFLAGWQSAPTAGVAQTQASVSGKWPSALRGTLLRNGPGLFERDGQRYQHWFDGDGLMQSWTIGEHGVSHRARFVQTAKFVRENRSGKLEVMAAGTTVPNARAVSGPDDANTANTSVMHIGGKTYALWEAGSAYEIDADTLATMGPKVWRDDLEAAAFSAHPVYEKDGSIWNFGLFDTKMIVYQIGSDGVLLQAQLVDLPHGGYMHSFSASESKLIFVIAPLLTVRDAGSFFEGLGWKPELGSLMVVLPKADLAAPRFAEFESGAAYHFADAWDEADGSVAVRACWYDTESGFASPFGHYVQGFSDKRDILAQTLVEIRLAPGAKRATITTLSDARVEFPVPTQLMRKSPALYLRGRPNHRLGALSGVLSLDANAKTIGEYDFGDDYILEEQLPVRTAGKRYTLGTLFNAKKAQTSLVLFDLERLNAGPIAKATLDTSMPLGFHGTFIAKG
jgi:all-trans-8'-apo-beta-carotenal 15,15'-oxygenase